MNAFGSRLARGLVIGVAALPGVVFLWGVLLVSLIRPDAPGGELAWEDPVEALAGAAVALLAGAFGVILIRRLRQGRSRLHHGLLMGMLLVGVALIGVLVLVGATSTLLLPFAEPISI